MRLEDWQKYIESQFLDDEVEEKKAEAAPAPKTPADQGVLPLEPSGETTEAAEQTPLDAERKADETVDVPVFQAVKTAQPAEDSPDIPAMRAESAAAPLAVPAPEESQADLPTFIVPASIETTDGGTADIPLFQVTKTPREAPPQSPAKPARYAARGSEADTPIPAFGPVPDVDADIPVFSNYLPSTHEAVKTNAATAPVAPSSESPTRSLAGAHPPVEQTEPPQAAAPATSRTPRETPPRRVPKHRAPHARNVRPESVPSGLSATELWAQVPRHVQTLLALERLEEQETAQSSYKRPFQEKRHELIERILDPILSLEDTARLLNVCPTTVRRYTNKGILTHYRKEPEHSTRNTARPDKETRQRRFRLSDILAFLETQQAAIEADRKAERRAAGMPAPPAFAGPAGSSDSEETPGSLFAP